MEQSGVWEIPWLPILELDKSMEQSGVWEIPGLPILELNKSLEQSGVWEIPGLPTLELNKSLKCHAQMHLGKDILSSPLKSNPSLYM